MTTITAAPLTGEAGPIRRSWMAQLATDTVYVLIGFPLGVVSFVLVVTGLSFGVGLIPLLLTGVPVLVGTLFAGRGFAEVERSRIAAVMGRPRVGVRYRRARPEAQSFARMVSPLGEVQYWLDAVHALARFPVNTAGFVIVVTWWSTALAGLTYGLWEWALPHADPSTVPIVVNDRGLLEVLGLENTSANRIMVYLVVGVVFALTLPFVVRACALAEAWVAHGLLNGVAGLRDQVAELSRDRDTAQAQTASAVSAEATALRRLERDLHDGPQQRLVRLAVDLGRARQQLDADPGAARVTVDEAIAQTREALDELRTLSRGIAPPILTDRGLAAAVAALAARATVPVSVDIPALPRMPALVEQTAYFTIAETLANVAKHSGATRVTVTVHPGQGRLHVTVTDDGRGGAHIAKGHGLAGLHDRLHAAGGSLWVSSPSGGPTSVRAELPYRPESGAGVADDSGTAVPPAESSG
jgi:signal transduction histidine kinase